MPRIRLASLAAALALAAPAFAREDVAPGAATYQSTRCIEHIGAEAVFVAARDAGHPPGQDLVADRRHRPEERILDEGNDRIFQPAALLALIGLAEGLLVARGELRLELLQARVAASTRGIQRDSDAVEGRPSEVSPGPVQPESAPSIRGGSLAAVRRARTARVQAAEVGEPIAVLAYLVLARRCMNFVSAVSGTRSRHTALVFREGNLGRLRIAVVIEGAVFRRN